MGDTFPPDSPHSWLLQAAVAGGLPLLLGVAVLSFLILRSARDGIRTAEPGADRDDLTGAVAAVAAYGLMLLTAFTSAATTPVAAFIGGGLVAAAAGAEEPLRPAKESRPVGGWRSFPAEVVASGLLVTADSRRRCRPR